MIPAFLSASDAAAISKASGLVSITALYELVNTTGEMIPKIRIQLGDSVEETFCELNGGEVFRQIRLEGIDGSFFDDISIAQRHRKRIIGAGLTERQGNSDEENRDSTQEEGIG